MRGDFSHDNLFLCSPPFKCFTNGQWTHMKITSSALESLKSARLTVSPVKGSGSCMAECELSYPYHKGTSVQIVAKAALGQLNNNKVFQVTLTSKCGAVVPKDSSALSVKAAISRRGLFAALLGGMPKDPGDCLAFQAVPD